MTIQETIKENEKKFDEEFVKDLGSKVEPIWKDSIGCVGPVKSFLHQAQIRLLESVINHLKERQLTYEPNLSYQDPDFRITQEIYEDCLGDTINTLEEIINGVNPTKEK